MKGPNCSITDCDHLSAYSLFIDFLSDYVLCTLFLSRILLCILTGLPPVASRGLPLTKKK